MTTDGPQCHGYALVDPGLAAPWCELSTNYDAQVRCLAYLIRKIPEFFPLPEDIKFEVIPCEYLGGPHPAIGMYSERWKAERDSSEDLTVSSLHMGDRLEAFIAEIGVERLVELSSAEEGRWQDILHRFGM